MPHGALDVALGPQLLHWAVFFPLYGLLAGLTVAMWFGAPPASLGLFLVLSWFHFGSGDAGGWGFGRWGSICRGAATGGLVLGLPLAAHADVVAPIFSHLLLRHGAMSVTQVQTWGFVVCAVVVPAAVLTVGAHISRRQWTGAAEIVLLCALGIVASPLVSFAVYFALWHSPRHMLEVRAGRRATIPTLIATVATIGVASFIWVRFSPEVSTAIQVVFIGLAALTVPHLLVTEGIRRKHRRIRH